MSGKLLANLRKFLPALYEFALIFKGTNRPFLLRLVGTFFYISWMDVSTEVEKYCCIFCSRRICIVNLK